MTSELTQSDPRRLRTRGKRRFKRRELTLPDGDRLVVEADGSIDRVAPDGTTSHSWAPDDADWPRQAIRFGLHIETTTASPHGRRRSEKPF